MTAATTDVVAAALIALAIDAWRITDGAFDPTVLDALVNAGYGQPFAAGPTKLGPALDVPGAETIEVDPTTGKVGDALTCTATASDPAGGTPSKSVFQYFQIHESSE